MYKGVKDREFLIYLLTASNSFSFWKQSSHFLRILFESFTELYPENTSLHSRINFSKKFLR